MGAVMHEEISIHFELECPSEFSGWKVHSFNTRHVNFKHPHELSIQSDGSITNPGLRRKLDVGLAFILAYYEHGASLWYLPGEGPPGADCPWDSIQVAGVLIWKESPNNIGATTYEDRKADAVAFLDSYNKWCNGEAEV